MPPGIFNGARNEGDERGALDIQRLQFGWDFVPGLCFEFYRHGATVASVFGVLPGRGNMGLRDAAGDCGTLQEVQVFGKNGFDGVCGKERGLVSASSFSRPALE
jgi:hypothetical protein